jgi:5-methylcytosine-specific restriction protein A
MTRTVDEWIGATPDTPIPPRVRLRVFEAHQGRCHISGRKITPADAWDCDHVVALVNWSGEGHGNRESNLAPALRDKHREKTAADVAEKSMIRRKRAKHLGIKPKGRPIPGSKASGWRKRMDGTAERRNPHD